MASSGSLNKQGRVPKHRPRWPIFCSGGEAGALHSHRLSRPIAPIPGRSATNRPAPAQNGHRSAEHHAGFFGAAAQEQSQHRAAGCRGRRNGPGHQPPAADGTGGGARSVGTTRHRCRALGAGVVVVPSVGSAAQIAGLPLPRFLEILSSLKIPVVEGTAAELEDELAQAHSWLGQDA